MTVNETFTQQIPETPVSSERQLPEKVVEMVISVVINQPVF